MVLPAAVSGRAPQMDSIGKCALHLFERLGYQGTSVRQIAEACGMSLGTLYYYIGSKENILAHLVSQDVAYIGKFLDAPVSSGDKLASLRMALERWYRYCDERQDWLLVGTRETVHMPKEVRNQLLRTDALWRAAFEKLLADGVEARQIETDDMSTVAINIVLSGHAWAVRRWHLKKEVSLEDYIRRQTAFFLRALEPRVPGKNR